MMKYAMCGLPTLLKSHHCRYFLDNKQYLSVLWKLGIVDNTTRANKEEVDLQSSYMFAVIVV